jgi:hypothetical protein
MIAVKCAGILLPILAPRSARQRAGKIEVYGSEYFKNYAAFLKDFVRDPRSSWITAGIYAGGISKQDMFDNNANPDVVTTPSPDFLRSPWDEWQRKILTTDTGFSF